MSTYADSMLPEDIAENVTDFVFRSIVLVVTAKPLTSHERVGVCVAGAGVNRVTGLDSATAPVGPFMLPTYAIYVWFVVPVPVRVVPEVYDTMEFEVSSHITSSLGLGLGLTVAVSVLPDDVSETVHVVAVPPLPEPEPDEELPTHVTVTGLDCEIAPLTPGYAEIMAMYVCEVGVLSVTVALASMPEPALATVCPVVWSIIYI